MTAYGTGPFGVGPFGGATHWEYTAQTNALFARLPDYIRRADDRSGNNNFLKRYLSTIIDQFGEVMALFDRIDYVAPSDGGEPFDSSDLTDPTRADVSWLPWLAQLVGVRLDTTLDVEAQRDAVLYASSGWQAGTKGSVAAAAKSVLTGSKFVLVYDHSTESGIGAGGEWDLLVVTRAIETPDPDLVLSTIIAKRAKPAGVLMHYLAYSASWLAIETIRHTWAGVEASPTWADIEQTGLAI